MIIGLFGTRFRALYVQTVNSTNATFENANATKGITSNRFYGKLDCSNIDGGSDADFCSDNTNQNDGNNRTITYVAAQDGAGLLCSNCPAAGTEFFPIVIVNFNGTNFLRVVAFCDVACNANTVIEIINDADNSVIASVSGPNSVDTAEVGTTIVESLSGDINTKVRIKGSGAAAEDYRVTNVYMEMAR
jgi:hypothetical protein